MFGASTWPYGRKYGVSCMKRDTPEHPFGFVAQWFQSSHRATILEQIPYFQYIFPTPYH